MRAQAEQRRRAERRLRHLTEDLRYALRKVSALPVEDDAALERPWEEWRPKLAALELKEWSEMQRLDIEEDKVDESRKSAWERFVRRQKVSVSNATFALRAPPLITCHLCLVGVE